MMNEDIEMLEAKLNGVATPHPHLATDSHHASPIVVDPSDDDNISTSNEPPSVVVHDVDGKVKQQAPKSKPAHEAATGAKPASSAPKPKSSRARPRSPSPSPPPAPPPAPLQTVRLEIALGGPDNYEVDVAALAKATGQRPPTPPPVAKRYESESEAEPEGEHDDDRKSKKGKKVRRVSFVDSTARALALSEYGLQLTEMPAERRRFCGGGPALTCIERVSICPLLFIPACLCSSETSLRALLCVSA